MSYTVLLCPSCASEVRTRTIAGQRSRGMITCESCGENFNLHEFNPKREVTTHAYIGGIGSDLPITLRPSGTYGDQSDATFVSANDGGFPQTITTTFTSSNLGIVFNGDPSALDLYARISVSFAAAGPLTPTVGVRFKEGAAGTPRTAGTKAAKHTDGTFDTYGPYTVTTAQVGSWTAAKVATLRVQAVGTTDDNGSGQVTTINCSEIWIVAR